MYASIQVNQVDCVDARGYYSRATAAAVSKRLNMPSPRIANPLPQAVSISPLVTYIYIINYSTFTI